MPTPAKSFVPEGYSTATPYLVVHDGARALDWYVKAFGGVELYRLPMPNGKIAHAELRIGSSVIMLADEDPQFGNKSAKTLGGTPVGMCLYVEDCDRTFKQAVELGGCSVLRELADQFYGDRSGTFVDPFGHQWTIATHKLDFTREEMAAAMAKMTEQK